MGGTHQTLTAVRDKDRLITQLTMAEYLVLAGLVLSRFVDLPC
ncbi:hypothetical protein [Streptomyces sp. PU_AKi4]